MRLKHEKNIINEFHVCKVVFGWLHSCIVYANSVSGISAATANKTLTCFHYCRHIYPIFITSLNFLTNLLCFSGRKSLISRNRRSRCIHELLIMSCLLDVFITLIVVMLFVIYYKDVLKESNYCKLQFDYLFKLKTFFLLF